MDGMNNVFLFIALHAVLFVLDNHDTCETRLAQLLQIAFQRVFGEARH